MGLGDSDDDWETDADFENTLTEDQRRREVFSGREDLDAQSI